MFRIAILKNDKAFLPEADAYYSYLKEQGFCVKLLSVEQYHPLEFDVVFLFFGFFPAWREYSPLVVGEYHSLSTGKYGRIKDFLKRALNVRPDIGIFLNDKVRTLLAFDEDDLNLLRPMGFNDRYANKYKLQDKEFDVVYSGSLREGVKDAVTYLAEIGFKVAVVGNVENIERSGITCFGRVSVEESYKIMGMSKYGLNLTPDVFPLNIQDSTKVIEYSALGLRVITNRYKWLNEWEKSRDARFLDFKRVRSIQDVSSFEFIVPEVHDLSWSNILSSIGLAEKLRVLCAARLK